MSAFPVSINCYWKHLKMWWFLYILTNGLRIHPNSSWGRFLNVRTESKMQWACRKGTVLSITDSSSLQCWRALSPALQHCVEGSLVREVRKEKQIKVLHIRKEEVELSLFIDDVLCIQEIPKCSPKNLTRANKKKFSKVARYKINTQRLVVFLYISNGYKKIENNSI